MDHGRRSTIPNGMQIVSPNMGGGFSSVQSFSSVSSMGPDGVMVSESKCMARDSTGRAKISHQRKMGEKSRTFTREGNSRTNEWKQEEILNEIDPERAAEFNQSWENRRGQPQIGHNHYRNGRSHRGMEHQEMPLAIGYNHRHGGERSPPRRIEQQQPLPTEYRQNYSHHHDENVNRNYNNQQQIAHTTSSRRRNRNHEPTRICSDPRRGILVWAKMPKTVSNSHGRQNFEQQQYYHADPNLRNHPEFCEISKTNRRHTRRSDDRNNGHHRPSLRQHDRRHTNPNPHHNYEHSNWVV